jgi:tetratricopeptide (TPR) repeat protein
VVSTSSIEVFVQGPGGASVAGQATVTVKKLGGQVFGQGTTKAGYLRINNLASTEYTLSVEAPGYEAATRSVDLTGLTTKSITVELRPVDPENSNFAARIAALPGKAQREVFKASEALRVNRPSQARDHLESARRIAPNHPEVTYLFGVYSSQSNDWVQAKTYWAKAIELYPKHLRALLSLSEALLRENKPAEALSYASRAVAAEPSSWRAHAVLAEAYLLQGSHDDAIKEAQRAVDLGHGQAAAIQPILSRALAERGEKEPAIRVLQSYVRSQPTDAAARKQLENLQTVHPSIDMAATTSEIAALAADSAEAQPNSWRAHAILAEAYMLQGSREQAIHEAERAQELGHDEAAMVQPLLARAVATSGDTVRAASILQTYLRDHPADVAARKQLESLQNPQEPTTSSGGPSAIELATQAVTTGATALPLVSNWLPPDVDERMPPADAGAACSVSEVIQKAGRQVMKLVADVDRFTATESLAHQSINKWGFASPPEKRKFDYVVSIEEVARGFLNVEEYRNNHGAPADFPDGVETDGLPALVLIFHPYNATNFEMSCEGLAAWNGEPAWQVHFRQRADRPNTIRHYKLANGPSYPVALKGRAWISADNYQIVRLETDLVAAIPQIRLMADHTAVEYGPVQFRKSKIEMWLPQSAEVFYDWKGHRIHRRHSFSNYLLFAVDDKQRISAPKGAEEPPPGAELEKPKPNR